MEHQQKKWDPIKFIKSCNVLKLVDEIDEETWIDHTFPLAFDYFNTKDDFIEYLGAHSELPKSNKKYDSPYVLNEYAYFDQEVDFHDVL